MNPLLELIVPPEQLVLNTSVAETSGDETMTGFTSLKS